MKNYELTYLITPDLSTEEVKTLSEKIVGFVTETGAISLNNAEPAKIKLAYPIKKKQEAWLVSLTFSLMPEKIKEVKEKISSESQVLRNIIVVKAKEGKRKTSQIKEEPKQTIEKNLPAGGKVEIEKIDEKIDEILK